MALADVLKSMFAEVIETIAEQMVQQGVDELQEEFDRFAEKKFDEILQDLLDKLPDEVDEYASIISQVLKPLVLSAIRDAMNKGIEYLWDRAQSINKHDADTPAPEIQ